MALVLTCLVVLTGNAWAAGDADIVLDVYDNCSEVYNPDQLDWDHDGFGDACELVGDANNDGIVNGWVQWIYIRSFRSTSDLRADFNRNGKIDRGDFKIIKNHYGNEGEVGPSGLACAGSIPCMAPAEGTMARAPNVVLIFSDDAAYNELELMGNPAFPTPNLVRLAESGVSFSNGYVTAPVCSPSRAGLMTGRYQQRFDFEHLIWNQRYQAGTPQGVRTDQVMLPERLLELGYRTGMVGKWHLGSQRANANYYSDSGYFFYPGPGLQPIENGFESFYGFLTGQRRYMFQMQYPDQQMRRDLTAIPWWFLEGDSSRYDSIVGPGTPSLGTGLTRYLTEAHAEEALAFIQDHYQDDAPFFLYLAFASPHYPDHAKVTDWDVAINANPFGTVQQQRVAAMGVAMDRAIGEVLDSLEDPNGDGFTDDSIADNTIVIFANDNGGSQRPYDRDNSPLRDWKFSLYEGGIRVPFVIRDPRLPAETRGTVYPHPVSTLDIFPTLVAAAGGAMTTPTDGVDLFPFLSGLDTSPPHDILRWRMMRQWAIRRGDWKLVASDTQTSDSLRPELYNLAEDIGETTDLSELTDEYGNLVHGDLIDDLLDDLGLWEAELGKPAWRVPADNWVYPYFFVSHNRFVDGFRILHPAGEMLWSDYNLWVNADNSDEELRTLVTEDAYANALLEFPVNSGENYTATNDMSSMTLGTFMLNEIRLSGLFAPSESSGPVSATINGGELRMMRNLQGAGPRLMATANGPGPERYAFYLDNDLELMHDLEIGGDGSESFELSGSIRSFATGRDSAQNTGIYKTGTSRVVLSGDNIYTGKTTVAQGELVIDNGGSIRNSQRVTIEEHGVLRLRDGQLIVPVFSNRHGIFEFTGGLLSTAKFKGDLVNRGGTFAPGRSGPRATVYGDYSQTDGVLELEIRGSSASDRADRLVVTGRLRAGGTLRISSPNFEVVCGETFILATARSITGRFDIESPVDESGQDIFTVHHGRRTIRAEVTASHCPIRKRPWWARRWFRLR